MNFSSNGREEPAGFNHSSFFDMEPHQVSVVVPKTAKTPGKTVNFEVPGYVFDSHIEKEITKKLEFKEWIGLPRSNDTECNTYMLIIV